MMVYQWDDVFMVASSYCSLVLAVPLGRNNDGAKGFSYGNFLFIVNLQTMLKFPWDGKPVWGNQDHLSSESL